MRENENEMVKHRTKKILFVITDFYRVGGIERTISTLAGGMSNDYDIEVMSIYKSADIPFFECSPKIKVTSLVDGPSRDYDISKKWIVGRCICRIAEKVQKEVRVKRRLNDRIGDFTDADVIIFSDFFTAKFVIGKLHNQIRNKKIVVRDAIHLNYYNDRTLRQISKIFPGNVDCIVVSSDESIATYEQYFSDGAMEFRKIYNPVGVIPTFSQLPRQNTVVAVGRIDEQKGFIDAIKAFEIISKSHPDWQLEIYGDGSERGHYEEIVSNMKLSKCVKFKGSSRNISSVLGRAGIFVFPSRYEGYANALVEALVCGAPAISYDWFMGVDEIIKNGKNGLVVKLRDRKAYFNSTDKCENVPELAKAINRLIESPELRKEFSEEAKKIFESRKIENILKEWYNLIENM